MVVGDPSSWATRFASVDDRLLERINVVWPNCLAVLPPNPEEDTITLNLVHLLLKDEATRQFVHWLEYQFHVWKFTPDGLGKPIGIVDLGVILDQQRERYLAYECKRLNVLYNGRRQSLAGPYVTQGLIRFITEQYADGLPVGGMLGYVLDGDSAFALSSVHSSIASNAQSIGLISGPTGTGSVGTASRFNTGHIRPASSNQIEVRHAFLPCK